MFNKVLILLLAAVIGAEEPTTKPTGKEWKRGTTELLVLNAVQVTAKSNKRYAIAFPWVGHTMPKDDKMGMYLRVMTGDKINQVLWIHFSQIKSVVFDYVKIPAKDAGSHKFGLLRPDRRKSATSGELSQANVLVTLYDGQKVKGWLAGEFEVVGIGPDDRLMSFNTTQDNHIAALEFTEFSALNTHRVMKEVERKQCVECSNYGQPQLKQWQRDDPKKRQDDPRFVWREKEKDLRPQEAAQLWAQNRASVDSWTVTEGKQSIKVQGVMINRRYRTNRGTIAIHVGSFWLENKYEDLKDFRSIKFTGKGTVEITPKQSDHPIVIDPEEAGADYLFMWTTPYGFAGMSVYPFREVTFSRD